MPEWLMPVWDTLSGWLSAIKNLDTGAQAATIGGFLLALLTAVLIALGKLFTFLAKLYSGLMWIWRRLTSRAGSEPSQPDPAAKAGLINIPPGRAVIGRDAEVAALREKLMASSGGSVSLVNSGAVLRGQGGLGKSTLARRYAEVHGGEYDGVLWVEAQTRALCGQYGFDFAEREELAKQHPLALPVD